MSLSMPFSQQANFASRHIGPRSNELSEILKVIGTTSLEELIDRTIPAAIRIQRKLDLQPALSETEALALLQNYASENQVFRSFLGMGYYNTHTPLVIQRNILENPGWYTQYTPYQAEIAQGRLEALINFQTMVCDLTAMEVANASLLDEGTAAAEAMQMSHRVCKDQSRNKYFISTHCHPQTIAVVKTRAQALGIEVMIASEDNFKVDNSFFGALIQYPRTDGALGAPENFIQAARACEVLTTVASDLMALCLITPPGEFGADIVVGNSQRFGVPLGFGGPHAAFFATKNEYRRQLPGRLAGVSKDRFGNPAYRLTLQTREQHIRRETATSNICTAQVLLAVMASMYAVYHGPEGLREIATTIATQTKKLSTALKNAGCKILTENVFDTICVAPPQGTSVSTVMQRLKEKKINLRNLNQDFFGISLDQTTTAGDLVDLVWALTGSTIKLQAGSELPFEQKYQRKSTYLSHPVFSKYRSETEMLRYINWLQDKDLSLTHSMIPLGSCTMKLNATAQMVPVTWKEFASIHPFAPADQTRGYQKLFADLARDLATATGFARVSLQPNSGAQGEYAGLMVIRAYLEQRGETKRTICLIPESAHGTNPASAVMAGFKVVPVSCDDSGNIDLGDLKAKADQYRDTLAAAMVTYPSTHGVFEEGIKELCQIIHAAGGQVYMDGANLNAQVGFTSPGDIGADVCHLNLHKTFCIPHGGGGPGMGPIAVAEHLAPFLPGHPVVACGGEAAIGPISAAPWGSALILTIPWVYIKTMGGEGLTAATAMAIANANYLAKRLAPHYSMLYQGKNGYVAHECILDLREFKHTLGIEVEDIAKRLMDYGFHAPTVSWPVPGTLMIEPTESESKAELDRFCEAMIAIRGEIQAIATNKFDLQDNPLKNAPHTILELSSNQWNHRYSREEAAYPVASLRTQKFWPAVARIDNTYGDRNLFCSCIPIGEYQ
ncbi:aminomethyl-transferring glycine dehydrogenase [bacterium]|nr:aminomethyl-transferring glycine dehydrogenase [bacterium]